MNEDGNEAIRNTGTLCCDDKVGIGRKHMAVEDVALIGLDAIQNANSTLEDFCRSYFMFHGIDACQPQSIFKYLPILSFTESFIYQLDRVNEKLLQPPKRENTILYNKPCGGVDRLALKPFSIASDAFRPLVNLLDLQGLLTDRINEEFRNGIEYWSLESKLCFALASKMEISVTDVMLAIQLKSFDYRVLNLLLYQLRGEEVYSSPNYGHKTHCMSLVYSEYSPHPRNKKVMFGQGTTFKFQRVKKFFFIFYIYKSVKMNMCVFFG
ncbi:unnamed protein product [Cuscuta campestris]|uniref:Uncharacterized protein n=1 Tax=Cuscuta campestris TaxID=132261 RepID=A0A484MWY7_9ASTE|nr:unnamed protein product [Cuscuta campestris]